MPHPTRVRPAPPIPAGSPDVPRAPGTYLVRHFMMVRGTLMEERMVFDGMLWWPSIGDPRPLDSVAMDMRAARLSQRFEDLDIPLIPFIPGWRPRWPDHDFDPLVGATWEPLDPTGHAGNLKVVEIADGIGTNCDDQRIIGAKLYVYGHTSDAPMFPPSVCLSPFASAATAVSFSQAHKLALLRLVGQMAV